MYIEQKKKITKTTTVGCENRYISRPTEPIQSYSGFHVPRIWHFKSINFHFTFCFFFIQRQKSARSLLSSQISCNFIQVCQKFDFIIVSPSQIGRQNIFSHINDLACVYGGCSFSQPPRFSPLFFNMKWARFTMPIQKPYERWYYCC